MENPFSRFNRVVSRAQAESSPPQAPEVSHQLSPDEIAHLHADLATLRAERSSLSPEGMPNDLGEATPIDIRQKLTEIDQDIARKQAALDSQALPQQKAA